MTRTAANLPTPIRTDVFHGLDASSPQQTFPAAEGAEGAAGAKVGGDYNLPSQMREKRGHSLLPPSMGRRDGPTGGGAYHVGTLQRHYKKISDPLTYVGTIQRHYKKISDPLEEITIKSTKVTNEIMTPMYVEVGWHHARDSDRTDDRRPHFFQQLFCPLHNKMSRSIESLCCGAWCNNKKTPAITTFFPRTLRPPKIISPGRRSQ